MRLTIDPNRICPSKERSTNRGPADRRRANSPISGTSNGVQLAVKITILQNGKKFADVTVSDTQLNTGLKAEISPRSHDPPSFRRPGRIPSRCGPQPRQSERANAC